MATDGTTTTTTTPPTPTPPVDPAASTPPPAIDWQAKALEAQKALDAATAYNKKLQDENASRRVETRETRAQLEAEARAKGDLATVVKSLEQRVAEAEAEKVRLASLEPDAQAWKKHTDGEGARLDAEAATVVPEFMRDIYAGAKSVDEKRRVLDAARKVPTVADPKKPAPPAPPTGSPPSTPPPSNVDARTMSIDALITLQREDPAAYAKAVGSRSSATKPKTLIEAMGFGAKK